MRRNGKGPEGFLAKNADRIAMGTASCEVLYKRVGERRGLGMKG